MKLSEVKDLIENNPMALATVRDNKPHVIAVACVKVVDDKLLITDNYMNRTIDNIKQNKNVALTVWDKGWKGCNITGEAEYFESGEWLEKVKQDPNNNGMPAKGAILVTVTKMIPIG